MPNTEPKITPEKLRDLSDETPCVDARCDADYRVLVQMKRGLDAAAAEIERLERDAVVRDRAIEIMGRNSARLPGELVREYVSAEAQARAELEKNDS